MGWVGMGRLFLVKFAANLPLGNTQQLYSPLGSGGIIGRWFEVGVAEVAGRLTAKAPEDWAHSGTLRAVGASAGDGASGVITRHHAHHYFGFAETQWRLLEKERPRRVSQAGVAGRPVPPHPWGEGELSAGGLDDGGTEVAGRLTAKAPEDWAHSGTLRAVGASAGDGRSDRKSVV